MCSSILIVEDDPRLRHGMHALLSMECPVVNLAATLAEAQQQLDTTRPTHVILDLNMPDGLGTDLLRVIRARPDGPRVIVLTGSTEPDILAEAHRLGVDAVLTKPPNWDDVIRWASSE